MTNRMVFCGMLLAYFFVACNPNRVPKGFPEEEEFARILADVHYAEATIGQIRIKDRGVDSTANTYYHYILARHNLTQQKFDTVVSWYLSHPELYQEVYDKVIALLSEQEAHYERDIKEQEEEEERVRKEKQARSIWKGEKSYFITKADTFDRRIPFSISVDTIVAQGYQLSAFYQFLKQSSVKEPLMEVIALYADSTTDTLYYNLPATHINSKAALMIGFEKEQQVLQMEGFLVKHDTTEQIRARINNIEFEYIPVADSVR
ncbi:protein of unknown function [Saccharicrinis carchari]|uniref:DUF4296 domain-containing protein n=2 Tax=Saccharicrinis carchari TaxID=1168039 RepID=A0A521BUM8_SACCC|nr:protein of unknown function [Saccharicrinis carchari]